MSKQQKLLTMVERVINVKSIQSSTRQTLEVEVQLIPGSRRGNVSRG